MIVRGDSAGPAAGGPHAGAAGRAPAVITLLPRPATDLVAYTARLKTRFPQASEVYSMDVNAFTRMFGKPRGARTCPRAGEF